MRAPRWMVRADDEIVLFLRRRATLLVRVALGVVYVWFGALKLTGDSPVAGLVADTVPFLPRGAAVKATGAVEVAIGLALLSGAAVRVTIGLFVLQLLGTFGAVAARPEAMYDGNPLRLTVLGEFLLKNIVLLAAGLTVLARARAARPGETVGDLLTERAE